MKKSGEIGKKCENEETCQVWLWNEVVGLSILKCATSLCVCVCVTETQKELFHS